MIRPSLLGIGRNKWTAYAVNSSGIGAANAALKGNAYANIFIVALMGLALCGCATDPSVYRHASINCPAVGTSETDPQFAA